MRQGSLKTQPKLASQADSRYNVEVIKYCLPPRSSNYRRREHNLVGGYAMDSLYLFPPDDNPSRIDIRAIRKQKGYTQADIAEILHTSTGFLSQVENGTKRLPFEWVVVIQQLPIKEPECLETICAGCHQIFTPPKSRTDAKFCSQSCWTQHRNSQVLERLCPQCNTILTYKTYLGWQQAEKHKRVCKKCQAINFTGEKNPFYGQSHSQASRDKISTKAKGKRHSPSTEFKKGQKTLNKTPLYEIWLQKHGQEEADKRFQQLKQKQSLATSGSKNSMHGKPSPSGSGNGWSGWYKGFYFRSLHELSYIVNVLEKQGLSFESAEQRKYRIPYIDWNGKQRNYFADFIVENRLIVECKPKRLHTSKTVLLKENAARLFCAEIGMGYEIVSPSMLTDQEIRNLYTSGLLQWLPRYQKKYEDRYEK